MADAAGRFLALRSRAGDVVVTERSGGAFVFRVRPGPGDEVAVDEDGTTAFDLPDGRIGWAVPGDPSVHALPLRGRALRLDRGRVAVQDGERLRLADLRGRELGSLRTARWDLDDGRLAYARSCGRRTVVVTVSALDPPAVPAPCRRLLRAGGA
jgi:hypothetical protein